MYNMYSWDQPASPADEHTDQSTVATGSGESNGKAVNGKAFSPVHAVQIALDRRDNGGDAGPRRGH
ncbi:MAG TPA: hypothetical protein VKS82_16395 [Streptosporangiaceae bacterium]|nr:hypothetical protein [Streptosporangiaceae bacterium]